MAKSASRFFCKECGYESGKWLGQCPSCRAWNTFVEEPVHKPSGARMLSQSRAVVHKPVRLDEIVLEREDRIETGFPEFDRVLGGGIVVGAMMLVGGDPGIGKSTLLLQVCRNLAYNGKKVLYVSGEESLKQIKLRAVRLSEIKGDLHFLCETNIENITETIREMHPDLLVIDSIQTMHTDLVSAAPGSVSQVRETTSELLRTTKTEGCAVFVVGHVTKEGMVAGPRVLEHMVDAVLYFEGEGNSSLRILRGQKNRFGATNEIAVFEMSSEGLKQVVNPSERMLSGKPEGASGAVVTCVMEGTRPLLLEVQGLVTPTSFGMPRRNANGIDYNRVNLLLAVIEKRLGLEMSRYDAYINLAGGMRIAEPSTDLAIICALISSFKNLPIHESTIIFGEVGLSGEVRAVRNAEQRVSEAARLGFQNIMIPKVSSTNLKCPDGVHLLPVSNIQEALYRLPIAR